MTSLPHSPVTFSSSSVSDLLRSSSNGIVGIPLKSLGKARLGAVKRDISVIAKLKRGKKHDYPWPKDADENIKGGVLTHLSHFKPLKEKPKPVTLDFEKPLMDLERKIIDVRKMANETGLDFSDQIISLENKYHQALKDLYTHLTPIQRVSIARHPNRPTFLDHIFNITDKWVELHGDRAGYDDPAIVCGIGSINGRRYMFMGHQKGRNTKENIQRNFGMPTPHGYRKAMRFMYYADHHGFPIVTFIDTPGAFADLKSEELGQGEAIAHNLRTMFGLKVPIVSIVIGEGGSGGALAIGCANKLLMLENAVFYVASPEACAAILWKTAKASPKAAEKLKITATELCKLKICDGIIPEPLGGAHADSAWTSQQIKIAITEAMDELLEMDTQKLLDHRNHKFRQLGGFQEGIPQDPIKKVNMKKKDEPIIPTGDISKTPDNELEDEIEKLKQDILKARESSLKPSELGLDEMIAKLKREIDVEYSIAVEAMGLKDKIKVLQEEYAKASSSSAPLDPALQDKIAKLTEEFEQGLSTAPNYASLKYRQDMLKEISKAKKLSAESEKVLTLKKEINKRFAAVVKDKIEAFKAEVAGNGYADGNKETELKEKALKVKKEIQEEWVKELKALNLKVECVVPKTKDLSELTSSPELKSKIKELNKEMQRVMGDAMKSTDLKNKIELLKLESAKAGKGAGPELKNKIETLITQSLAEALSSSGLTERHEKLKAEISQALEFSGGMDGSLIGATQGVTAD
ncbi:Acetyl-coenzyme a carboxylase carboxyl transferase subunit alpha protein [Thalictrum thalictroides]|uniref:acetyl-CoA carboxytransferase n=1 Tax=Thalictrum thalictroides TaxID=46969 RepID=A0A7J6WS33_THATH|nr:Acetyl-coenzyme a carboxylase carboxyl transferase subunit alpha protein [Thalictrum thalictroides]